MGRKIRVYELAKELDISNKEALDLCIALGIGVRSHSSSIEDAQADRARRKAERDGIGHRGADIGHASEQPTAATRETSQPSSPVIERPVEARAEQKTPEEAGHVTANPVSAPAVPHSQPIRSDAPTRPTVAATTQVKPTVPEGGRRDLAQVIADEERKSSGLETRAQQPPARPRDAVQPNQPKMDVAAARPASPPQGLVGQPRPSAPQQRRVPGTPPGALSPTGKPIPPPPGGPPRSISGKPIPPPPRAVPGARPSQDRGGPRPGGFSGPRTGGPGGQADRGPRPGGFSGPRTGGPGGFSGPRTGGAPTGGPGGDRGPRPGGFSGPRTGGPGGGFAARGTASAGASTPASRGPAPGRGRAPQRQSKRRSKKNFEELEPTQVTTYTPSNAPVPDTEVIMERGSTAQEFAPKLNRSAGDVVRFLLLQGELVTATQSLSDDMIELFAAEIGAKVRLVDPGQEQEAELEAKYFDEDDSEDPAMMVTRPPVITVMGHVDHGKTKLLDRIREANVVATEAGGITQHIGAYQVQVEGKSITFIDTPGHEAFTQMRARGAQVTDIVILVVAADDGVMPQTIEAINHAKAAVVPIIVAINKVDRADADPTRVMQQLSEYGLVPEQWGGDTIMVEVSALQNMGVDDLLEQILVLAEVLELKANPTGRAKGVVLEANLDVGRGPVATVIVQKGTLHIGDNMIAGQAWGRVKAMVDEHGQHVKESGPSTPVQVLGFSEVPAAGDDFRVSQDPSTAKMIAEGREQRYRMAGYTTRAAAAAGAKLEDLFEQIQKGESATLNLIVKADVQGSLEALSESLKKLERPDVRLSIIHKAVGGINENDVGLAAASNATIIGFNVRPDRRSRELASSQDVEIRTYEIIYKVLEDIAAAMVGMLAPEYEEVVTGEAEVRDIFRVPKAGAVAGCYVRSGTITRGSKVRFIRDGVVIWKGTINSLRRFKDDVREVQQGFECGIGLSDFQDLRSGDLIETFEDREIPRS